MNKEDYSKYYIQGSDHYLIPKDVFDELFNEMSNWKEDTKKLKERIDKAIEYINKAILDIPFDTLPMKDSRWGENLLNILVGDTNE